MLIVLAMLVPSCGEKSCAQLQEEQNKAFAAGDGAKALQISQQALDQGC